jgi:hypothetical protein
MTPKVYVFMTVGVVLIFAIWSISRQVGAWRQSKLAVVADDKYRALTDEYRRLTDMAITAQEHSDLRLADLSVQIDDLRDKLDHMQRILKEVE